MDWKKFLKKLGFSENFSYSNRKVYSGFSLCFGVSLLLTVFFLNNPFKASVFPSSFGSWPFSFSTSSSSSSSVSGDEKTHGGNFVDKGKNSSLLDSNGGTTVFEKPHGGNFSEAMNNGSFLVNTQDPKSVNGKSGGFGDMGIEGKSMGNVSGNVESVRSFSREGGIAENTKGESSSNSTFTEKSRGSADMGAEKNGARNVSGNGVGVGSVGKEGTVVSKTQNVKPVMSDGNGTFIEKPGGIVDVGTETGNVTSKGVSVRSLDREEGDLETTHDRSSFEGKKIASSSTGSQDDFTKCDIFDGRWVRDEGKPYYPGGSCPHIDRDFDCYLNGRLDDDFLKWRWQPNHCNIPSLNGTDFLERLRGKKLIFVGDSLNRNMWESLVCILRHSVPNKKKVYEISGRKEFKKKGFYAFRYEDYNCTVDFVSAPFLVSPGTFKTRNASLETLRLDLMDRTKSMYHDADIVVFNTGHWWTHEKTSKGENYYQEGNHVYPRLKVMEAYRKALTTWARWVDKNIDANKTQVFFRGYSDTHFRGGQWNSGGQCHKETEPILNDTYLAKYPSKMKALEQVLEQMSTPVVYMNISKLTDYRKDAHPSIYRKVYKTAEEKIAGERSQDCSHWCLPGVPDTWNELLYASLLRLGRGSWQT